MKRNMSDLDRFLRVIVAGVFAYLYFGGVVTGALGVIILVLAGILVLTSILAFCPLYAPLGFSTYKR